jgi:alcohol dehydrogenase class IV|tara:strand:- start:5605 stop:6759 length:1155 start_codon:yes stop_codon:yes gene_type:complete
MTAAIYLPQILRIGGGVSKELPQAMADLGVSRPLIITDPFIASNGYLDQLYEVLESNGIEYGVFSDCVPDPTVESINAGLAAWQSGNYDCAVGFGGGSSMDSAKAIAVLAKHGGTMRDFKVPNAVPKGFPIIAVPTTAGTGSEATRATVITDTATNEKMLCMGIGLIPEAALVDFELTVSMPYRLTADTAIDSLCHAMEAYVSKKANPFTDNIALTAMAVIAKNVRAACEQPANVDAREKLMLAATQAGIAFSNSSVTLIHGMSRPIGAFYHVPHGLSNAMLMPAVTEYSLPGATKRYADCARVMDLASNTDSDTGAGVKLLDGLYKLNEDLAVPTPKGFGIDADDYHGNLQIMAEQALASGSPNNNPLVPTADEIISLYQKVY